MTQNSSTISRINCHLSLSRIRTLVLDFASLFRVPTSLNISTSRLEGPGPLPLELLEIRYPNYDPPYSLVILYRFLLNHLNPVRCTYHPFALQFEREGPWYAVGELDALKWSRIQPIDVLGLIPFVTEGFVDRVAGLPPPSILQRRVIRLHAASLLCDAWPNFNELLDNIAMNVFDFGVDAMQPGSLVLVAHSEEEKKELDEAVRGNQAIARWKSVFAVELEL